MWRSKKVIKEKSVRKKMTDCNRCGEEFENFFNGYHWCPACGKVFQYDMNEKA